MKCEIKLQTICKPFHHMNLKNTIHVEIDQKNGLEEAGGRRCVSLGSTREEGGRGEGDRKG